MISNKCYYAIRAVLELAKQEGSGPVTIGDIAQAQHIPARFLEAILRQLKQAGYTESVRGKEGGYYLNKPANEIFVGDIVRLIEGPLISINPTAQHHENVHPEDIFDKIWERGEKVLKNELNQFDFRELADEELNRIENMAVNYTI